MFAKLFGTAVLASLITAAPALAFDVGQRLEVAGLAQKDDRGQYQRHWQRRLLQIQLAYAATLGRAEDAVDPTMTGSVTQSGPTPQLH